MRLARFRPLSAVPVVLCLAAPAPAQPLLSDEDNAIYRAAFAAGHADRWPEARSLAGEAGDPTLAKVLLWMELKDSDGRGGFAPTARFLLHNPRWPSRAALRERAEDAMPDDLPDGDVAAFFDAFPPRTDDGVLRHIAALFALRRDDDARMEIDRAWAGRDFAPAGERAFLDEHGALLTGDRHWHRIDGLIWRGRTGAAKRLLPLVGDDRRRLARARILLRDGSYGVDAAIRAVPAHLRDDPGLIYERARWRNAHGAHAGAFEMLTQAPRDTAHTNLWARQRLIFARRAMDEGDRLAAYRALADHRRRSGAFHHEVEWLAGWLALRELDDPAAALDHFTTLHAEVRFPISKARGAYWAGRAAEEAGDPELAAAWYGLAAGNGQTFYGQLGAGKLDVAPRLPEPPTIAEEDIRAFADDELTVVARQLHEIGEAKLVRAFLLRMADADASGPRHRLVAELALAMNRPDLAVAVAKQALKSGAVLVEAGHPVLDLPPGGDVEPALALAVIRQESAFDPAAVSSSGALGLMQLKPDTAEEVARRLGARTSRAKLLTDPGHNMRLGMAYLDSMLDLRGGSHVAAIASYNAGPNRVRRWIAAMGDPRDPGVDIVDWIEEIPFSETRNYVQRVIESMQVYRMLGGAQAADLALGPGTACVSNC